MTIKRLVLVVSTLLAVAVILLIRSGKFDNPTGSGSEENMKVNFQNSSKEHIRQAKLLLNKIAGSNEFEELREFIFRSPHDWIACSVTTIKYDPTLELYSFYQNRYDAESYSKPVNQCRAAQLLVKKDSLEVVDSVMHEGYGDVVPATDGSLVVDWELPGKKRAEYEIRDGQFTVFE